MSFKHIFVFCFFLLTLSSYSQNINDLAFTNFEPDHFKCKGIKEVRKGANNKMWMITFDKGLACFNGYATKFYPVVKNSKNCPLSNNMHALYTDKSGSIWFGYENAAAVTCFDPKTEIFNHYQYDSLNVNSFPFDVVVSKIIEDTEGRMWISTWGGGLLLFDKDKTKFTHINIQTSKKNNTVMPSNSVRDLFELEKDKFLITFFQEVPDGSTMPLVFDAKSKTFSPYPFEEYFKNTDPELLKTIKHALTLCHFVYKDKYKNLWLGTYCGLLVLDHEHKIAKRVSGKKFGLDVLNLENTNAFIADEQDRIWVNTGNSGIMVVDLKTHSAFYHKQYTNCSNCVSNNMVGTFSKDDDGNIWVTSGGVVGIYYPLAQQFKLKSWENLKVVSANSSHNTIPVNQTLSTKRNLVYLSSLSGMSIYNCKKDSLQNVIKYSPEIETENGKNSVGYFKLYKDNILCSSCQIGVPFYYSTFTIYNETAKKVIFNKYPFPGLFFKTDTTSNCYVVVNEKIVNFNIETNRWDTIYAFNKKTAIAINYSEILKPDKWFLGGYDGFVIINPKTKSTKKFCNRKVDNYDVKLADSTFTNYYYNKKDLVWISSQTAIYSYNVNTEEIKKWNNEMGIENINVNGLVEDKIGNLWFTSRKSLFRYNFKTKQLFNFTKTFGIKGDGFWHNREYMDVSINDENIFFPAHGGLLFFNPEKIIIPHKKNVLSVFSITLNDSILNTVNREIFLSGKKNLSHDQNNLIFEICSDQLFTPLPNKFKYKLEGKEDKWIDHETSNKIIFQNLFPGTYTLSVKCINLYHVESETVSVVFTINKPFWKTWWFILLSLAASAFLLFKFIKQREKSLEKKKVELENTIAERTREVVLKAEEIQEQKEIIEEKQKELTDSIIYAKRIQNALLAGKTLLDKHLANYFIYFNPKDIVSGDFYWATEFNGKFYFIVADSTGHGVPGAFMSLLNINFLNEAINEKQITEPGLILDYVRNRLIQNLSEDGSAEGGKDGMDCSLICFDHKTNSLKYACANNPIAIIRNGEIIELNADRMPVGKSPKENISFSTQAFNVISGDLIYVITDGYADQFGGEKGKKLKYKYLKEILLRNSKHTMSQQRLSLKTEFENWKGNLEQVDDVCIIGIHL